MTVRQSGRASDPRLTMSGEALAEASRRRWPEIARPAGTADRLILVFGVLVALGLGALTMRGLSGERKRDSTPPSAVSPAVASSPPALPLQPAVARVRSTRLDDMGAGQQSRAMPMIIDNTSPFAGVGEASSAVKSPEDKLVNGLSQDELFAVRVAGDQPPVAQVVNLDHADRMVTQGTIIPAVLETALNTDLPGFARAIVSRDVRSFDGSFVVIPRGSRLIGQYKSAVVTGQSRAYVVWSRLIRPDGASVQLGSPATDARGEAGLPGEVNRHFWQRFGSSILLSVVSGAASAVGGNTSALVVAGSGAQSASAVALETDGKISPTIRVPLGTPIQVFTARDLDFSGLQASPASSSQQSRRDNTP